MDSNGDRTTTSETTTNNHRGPGIRVFDDGCTYRAAFLAVETMMAGENRWSIWLCWRTSSRNRVVNDNLCLFFLLRVVFVIGHNGLDQEELAVCLKVGSDS
jgi:hypothetical protein